MIFFLDDKLINDGAEIDGFYDFIQNIFLAYREGKHVIIISAKSATELINDKKVDETSRYFLRHYLAHDRANLNLLSFFSIIIKIVALDDEVAYSDIETHQEFRKINFLKLIDSSTIQKTILLGENGNDSEIYALFCEYYLSINNLSLCELSYKRQTGGGSTTIAEFKAIYEKAEEFCVCLLDSDRRIPTRSIGSTAKHVAKFCDDNYLSNPNHKCHHEVLKTLEVENLLPLRFYEDTYKSDDFTESHARYKFLEDNEMLHISHVDFKEGVKMFSETNDNEICEFWFQLVNKHGLHIINTSDSNCYLRGFGGNILKHFLDYDKDKIYNEVSTIPRLKEQWLFIGGVLSSFISGTRKIRAI